MILRSILSQSIVAPLCAANIWEAASTQINMIVTLLNKPELSKDITFTTDIYSLLGNFYPVY